MSWTWIRRGAPAAVVMVVLSNCQRARPAVSSPPLAAAAPPQGPPPVALAAPVPSTTSTRAFLKLDPSFRTCHDESAPIGGRHDVQADVARIAGACATRMTRAFAPFTGEQAAAAKPQTFRWKAKGSHCYRAYGVGGEGVKNLDLLLVDGSGIVLAQDGSDGPFPVALEGGAVCFKQDDDAALVVSVGDGTGAFAVEIWSD